MPTRDPQYYFPDGSLVLQVDQRLFNIQRSRLVLLSTVFSEMLEVPAAAKDPMEGTSDAAPIVLEGDKEDEFLGLLWAIHLSPHGVCAFLASTPSEEHCLTLLSVARLSRKYGFEGLDTWAMESLHGFMAGIPFFIGVAMSVRLLQVSVLFQGPILERSVALVKTAVLDGKVAILPVLTFSESLGITALVPFTYYQLLCGGAWFNNPEISSKQMKRLLCGYRNITQLWHVLSLEPICHHQCHANHLRTCQQSWQVTWRRATTDPSVTALAVPDVNKKLTAVTSLIEGGLVPYSGQGACRSVAPIRAKISHIWETMGDVFEVVPQLSE